jgi:hypothetical protein
MTGRRRFRPREQRLVAAVRLALDTDGLRYRKWGGEQLAKAGDWLVDNGGEVYTVDAGSFERTYARRSLGVYEKTAPVWAERADAAGSVATKEGRSAYGAGDWIVSNDEAGTDAYVIDAASFENRYEADD